jgi:hypothetical protein
MAGDVAQPIYQVSTGRGERAFSISVIVGIPLVARCQHGLRVGQHAGGVRQELLLLQGRHGLPAFADLRDADGHVACVLQHAILPRDDLELLDTIGGPPG